MLQHWFDGEQWHTFATDDPPNFPGSSLEGTHTRDGATWYRSGASVYRFDPSESWTTYVGPDSLQGGYATEDGSVCAVYVLGGRDAAFSVSSLVQIYDIATNIWSTGAPMPTARSNAMAGLISQGVSEDGKIAVFGGADDSVRT